MPARRSFSAACLVLGLIASARAEVSLARVWPQWQGAETFDRIAEYFGGKENDHGGDVVIRTHADVRAGYYFLVRATHPAEFAGGKFELLVVRPDSPEPKTFTFPAGDPAGAKAVIFQLGLTGVDWPGGKNSHPVAWKLTLLSADGKQLAEQHSFLWEK